MDYIVLYQDQYGDFRSVSPINKRDSVKWAKEKSMGNGYAQILIEMGEYDPSVSKKVYSIHFRETYINGEKVSFEELDPHMDTYDASIEFRIFCQTCQSN